MPSYLAVGECQYLSCLKVIIIKKSNKVNDLERMFTQPKLVESIHLSDWQIMTDDGWVDIYRSSKTMEKKPFFEEFLGEATEEGSKELTIKDLQRICV